MCVCMCHKSDIDFPTHTPVVSIVSLPIEYVHIHTTDPVESTYQMYIGE